MDWKKFFEDNKIDYAEFYITKDANEIKKLSNKVKYPFVLKAIELNHKSDKGGIIFVNREDELKNAIKAIKKLSNSILIQEKVKGREIVISCENDKTFGSYIMIGIGGTYI